MTDLHSFTSHNIHKSISSHIVYCPSAADIAVGSAIPTAWNDDVAAADNDGTIL